MRQPIRILHSGGGVIALSVLVAIASACIGTLVLVERERPASVRAQELSYLPKGKYLKVAVLGYRQIAADLIWIKAVQHLGGDGQTKRDYRWAYHTADVVTDIDPKFVSAYKITGTILGVWGGLVEESIAILRKGIRHNPDDWELPFTVGYNYFFNLCDPSTAAEYFRKAASLPGAPAYLPNLAARMTVEGGDHSVALEFLQRFYQQTKEGPMREALLERMKEVIVDRDIELLEEAVRRYRVRYNRDPVNLDDLTRGGIILKQPEDPYGGMYRIHPQNGSVASTMRSTRLRVYRHVACKKIHHSS